MRRVFAAIVTCILLLQPLGAQLPPFGGAGELVADLKARRAATMALLGREQVLVLWSAPPRVYSTDTNYEYRQESNLLYLTGLDEEDVTLVLAPGAAGPNEFLFIRASDPFRELWNGHIPTPEEATARAGITQVFTQRGTESFDAFMAGLLGSAPSAPATPAAASARQAGTAAGLSRGGIRLALVDLPPQSMQARTDDESAASAHGAWLRRFQQQHPEVALTGASQLLSTQRQIKTRYEQRLLRRSVEISAQAHIEGMKAARPGRWEYEVEAAIEHWFLKSGALSWGYPSIVASGPNATTLHYLRSTRQMAAGDLLLVDAAGNYQGLTGDITRTYPVSGTFSPEQRRLYEIVLRAQEAGIAAARPGGSVEEINRAVRIEIGKGLLEVGLVTDPRSADGEGDQIGLWFPHGPVHGIGIDVHDPLGALDPGAAFVVEPGIYIRPDTLERLARNPLQADLARSLAPMVERYKWIGIRIEDSILMTESGPEVLSTKTPKQIRDIERLVGTGQ